MPGLKLYTSNRLEILVERLAQIVREPPASALQPEVVVIQSRGMERWISMALANHNGICANMSFPFPNAFLQKIFQQLAPDLPTDSPFDPAILTFRIMKTLPSLLDQPEFRSLKTYLTNDDRQIKLYQLSDKIADMFDQYLVFRPELIFRWEAGKNGDMPDNFWQAALWRALVKGKKTLHRAYLQKTLLARMTDLPADQIDIPAQVSVFGVSYLPPYHLQAFVAISRITKVNFFLLNPCREYWADIYSDREIRRWVKRFAIGEGRMDDFHLEKGNSLLSSMSKLGRDFFALIGEYDCEIDERFEDVPCSDMLSCIQSDILNLNERNSSRYTQPEAGSDPLTTLMPSPVASRKCLTDDTSIQIYSCHSPIRELEVLHDHLLAMFSEDTALIPKDVIVMAPDIESYAPFIDAVFGTQLDNALSIPYSIADRGTAKKSPVFLGFMALLDLKNKRFGANQILILLQLPGVKERHGITSFDLDIIERWVRDLNIRWGRDAADRREIGLPEFSANTWRAGLDRILMGLAMPGYDKHMFSDILPYDHIEGGDTQILGKFLHFLEHVFQWATDLEQPRALRAWQATLIDLLEQFFHLGENTEQEVQLLRNTLEHFGQMEKLAGYDENIELEVVRANLVNRLERMHHGSGFIAGGVTFCAMVPMRCIPFKVVCLIGMDNDAFPRDTKPLEFDLIRRHPRPGDRSRRKDDKYLFLEAMISARRKFYISYVGQSIQDNTPIPPAVPVSELIDYIKQGFGLSEENIVTRHPLQAFSPDYYRSDESKLFSYSKENLTAIRSMGKRKAPAAFISKPLSKPSKEWKNLQIEQLCRFFSHPAKFFLQNRLGLYRKEGTPVFEDKENFNLDALSRYRISQDLLKTRSNEMNMGEYFEVQSATGELPQGSLGRILYHELDRETEAFAKRLEIEVQNMHPSRQEFDLQLSDFRLCGELSDLYPAGRVQIRFARRKARDLLTTWINHLVLNIDRELGLSPLTTLVCRDSITRFEAVENPANILKDLLGYFWEGLTVPIHFLPETSCEFVKLIHNGGKTVTEALNRVRNMWFGSEFHRGESQDPYYRLCFDRADPLDDRFRELSQKIFSQLFKHTEEIIT